MGQEAWCCLIAPLPYPGSCLVGAPLPACACSCCTAPPTPVGCHIYVACISHHVAPPARFVDRCGLDSRRQGMVVSLFSVMTWHRCGVIYTILSNHPYRDLYKFTLLLTFCTTSADLLGQASLKLRQHVG